MLTSNLSSVSPAIVGRDSCGMGNFPFLLLAPRFFLCAGYISVSLYFNRIHHSLFIQRLHILLPFHWEHIFLFVIAFLAARDNISLCAFAPADYGHNVIHCKLRGFKLFFTIVTCTAAQLILPPLGVP